MSKFVGLWLVAVLGLSALASAADVTVSGFVQYQYVVKQTTSGPSDPSNAFGLKAARLKGAARMTDRISAGVLIDGTKQPSVLDVNVDYAFSPYLALRAGQFQLPFGYETQNSNFDVEAIDRSQVVSWLWYNGTTRCYSRDQGAMLMGRYTLLEYKVACVNGSGLNTVDGNNYKDIVGRVGLGIPMFAGLGFSVLRGKWGPKDTLEDRNALGFDLFLDTGKVLLETEYISADGLVTGTSTSADVKHGGYYVIVGYRITPLIEPVFKYDKYDPDKDAADDEALSASENASTAMYFGVNLNLYGKARLQSFYVVKDETPSVDNNQFMMQVSAKF
jgi:hypothetical protein